MEEEEGERKDGGGGRREEGEREGEDVPSATDLVGKYNQYVEKIKDSNGGYDTFAKAFHKWLQVKGLMSRSQAKNDDACICIVNF